MRAGGGPAAVLGAPALRRLHLREQGDGVRLEIEKIEKETIARAREDADEHVPAPALPPPVLRQCARRFRFRSAYSARGDVLQSLSKEIPRLQPPCVFGVTSTEQPGIPTQVPPRRHPLRGGEACFARHFPRAFYRGAAAPTTTDRRSVRVANTEVPEAHGSRPAPLATVAAGRPATVHRQLRRRSVAGRGYLPDEAAHQWPRPRADRWKGTRRLFLGGGVISRRNGCMAMKIMARSLMCWRPLRAKPHYAKKRFWRVVQEITGAQSKHTPLRAGN